MDLLRVHLNSSKKVWDVRAIAALNLVGYWIAGRISMHLDKPPGNNNLNVFLTNDNHFLTDVIVLVLHPTQIYMIEAPDTWG